MSPQLYQKLQQGSQQQIDKEKSDIFSLGLLLLQDYLSLKQQDIQGLNASPNGPKQIKELLHQIKDDQVSSLISSMLEFEPADRVAYSDVLRVLRDWN